MKKIGSGPKQEDLTDHCTICRDYLYQADDCVYVSCYSCHQNICEWCSGIEKEDIKELNKDKAFEYICDECDNDESAREFIAKSAVQEEIRKIYHERCAYLEQVYQELISDPVYKQAETQTSSAENEKSRNDVAENGSNIAINATTQHKKVRKNYSSKRASKMQFILQKSTQIQVGWLKSFRRKMTSKVSIKFRNKRTKNTQNKYETRQCPFEHQEETMSEHIVVTKRVRLKKSEQRQEKQHKTTRKEALSQENQKVKEHKIARGEALSQEEAIFERIIVNHRIANVNRRVRMIRMEHLRQPWTSTMKGD